jgi:hypothetical protein
MVNPVYQYFNKEFLAVFPQMGTIEYTMEFPVSIIEFEGGTRTQRVGQWAFPRYRFNWQLINLLPTENFPQEAEWTEIWEFYKRHRGQEKSFWFVYGFPIPDINILTANAGSTSLTVTAVVGLTTESRVREGHVLHISTPSAGEINKISVIAGSQSPFTLNLTNALGGTYTDGDLRFAYEVILDEDNLEIEQLVELLLTTGLKMTTL